MDTCPLPNAWLPPDERDHEVPAFLEGIMIALRQLFLDCLRKTVDLRFIDGEAALYFG